MVWVWAAVFVVSVVALVYGADWLLRAAEHIGLALGVPAFIVGVVLVGLGTSLPELIAALVAVADGVTDIPPANAVGSNVANILFVVGALTLVKRRIEIRKDLLDLDLSLLAIVSVVFLATALDAVVSTGEAVILVIGLVGYLVYNGVVSQEMEPAPPTAGGYPERPDDGGDPAGSTGTGGPAARVPASHRPMTAAVSAGDPNPPAASVRPRDVALLLVGMALLGGGAQFTVDSVVRLSELLNMAPGVIALLAIAFGTSLPELIVSVKATAGGDADVALGNIVGSSVFNLLAVVGISGLFADLTLDDETMRFGLPALGASALLFILSCSSKRLHVWEGLFYVLLYALVVGKFLGAL